MSAEDKVWRAIEDAFRSMFEDDDADRWFAALSDRDKRVIARAVIAVARDA